MVGKNNKFLKENKNNQRFLRFSLRKLSVGVVSVAIAAGFYIGGSQSVLADTPSTVPVVSQSTSNDNLAENTDKNTVNLQNSSASADSSAATVASSAASTTSSKSTDADKASSVASTDDSVNTGAASKKTSLYATSTDNSKKIKSSLVSNHLEEKDNLENVALSSNSVQPATSISDDTYLKNLGIDIN